MMSCPSKQNYFLSSSVCQSQLIHCLAAKNRKVVNEVLIENLLYKDLISYILYSQICSNGLFKIFPLIQFLGKHDIILFHNLVAALTVQHEKAEPFFDSIKSFLLYYQKNKQMISFSSEINEAINDEINDDEANIFVTKHDNDSFVDLNISTMFSPKRILSFLDKNLQEYVLNHFEALTKTDNFKVCHLKPSLSTAELLDAITDSIVPELNLKKLNFCLASFSTRKNDGYLLFWVALPYLLSQHSYLRRISVNFIASVFGSALKKNEESGQLSVYPFDEFVKILNRSKNLQFLLKMFGEVIRINFEENLLITFASIFVSVIVQDDKNKVCMFRLLYLICAKYKKKPSKASLFLLILIVFTNKISINFVRKFDINFSASFESNYFISLAEFFKETASSCSRFEILWILNFLVWAYSMPAADGNKYQAMTILIFEILKLRTDLPIVFKRELISRFLKYTDNKDQNIQEYLAFIFAITNSSVCDIDEEVNASAQKSGIYDQLEKLNWEPKNQNLVEQHLQTFCVNFHEAIKGIIDIKS